MPDGRRGEGRASESSSGPGGADAETAAGGVRESGGAGRLRRWAIRVVQIALTVVVTWFIVNRVGVTADDVAALDSRWLRPAWGLLGLASGVLAAGFFFSAALWGRMVRELGGPRLSVAEAASIYFTSNLGRYVPGKVWQLAGLTYLSRRAGVPASLAAGSGVLAQATSLAGATVIGSWALLDHPGVASGWGRWAAGGILVAVAAATLPPVFRRIADLWLRVGGDEVSSAEVGVGPGFGPRWVLLFAANWVVYAGAFWLMALSFGVEGSALALGPAFAASYVLGYAMIFAPAGLGVREGFLIAFLQPVAGPGPATATAVLARFWMTAVELLPAIVFAGLRVLSGPDGEGER